MKKQLSGTLNFVVKIIIPGLWIFMWGVMVLMMLIGVDERTQPPSPFSSVFEIIFTAILYFTAMRYMKVAVDTKYLYVSNYFREISIPLSNIRDVTEIIWLRGHPVTIHLKTPSEFGSKIPFLPKSQGFNFLRSHPVVSELKELAKTHSGTDLPNFTF